MHIGFAAYDSRLTYWALVAHAAQARAKELGVELTIITSPTLPEQVRAIAELRAQRVDVLVIGPIDTSPLAQIIDALAEDGIPVVLIGTEIPNSQTRCVVSTDNTAGLAATTAYLAQQLKGQGEVIHLQGPAWGPESAARAAGFQQALTRYPALRVACTLEGDWTRATAACLVGAALETHPHAQGLVAANDVMGLGAIDAIAAAGRTGTIHVVSFDGLPEALLAVQSGTMLATVDQAPVQTGRAVIEAAMQLAQSHSIPSLVPIPATLVTRENVGDMMAAALQILPLVLVDAFDSRDQAARERALLRTVVDAIPDTHIFIKDTMSRFQLANREYLQTLGAAQLRDVIGKTDFDLFSHEHAAHYAADEQAVIATGKPLYDRIELVHTHDGQQRWYLTSKVPLCNDEGCIVGIIGSSRNITAIKQLEDERATLQKDIINAQEAALRELSTPLIPVFDDIVVLPLIGSIDSKRAAQFHETLLHGISSQQARVAIVDITGVPVVDTQVADALLRGAQAARMLGTQIILTGIRPEVAQTLVSLGANMRSILTCGTLQSGIARALQMSGTPVV